MLSAAAAAALPAVCYSTLLSSYSEYFHSALLLSTLLLTVNYDAGAIELWRLLCLSSLDIREMAIWCVDKGIDHTNCSSL